MALTLIWMKMKFGAVLKAVAIVIGANALVVTFLSIIISLVNVTIM